MATAITEHVDLNQAYSSYEAHENDEKQRYGNLVKFGILPYVDHIFFLQWVQVVDNNEVQQKEINDERFDNLKFHSKKVKRAES